MCNGLTTSGAQCSRSTEWCHQHINQMPIEEDWEYPTFQEVREDSLPCDHPECREPWTQLDMFMHHHHRFVECEDCMYTDFNWSVCKLRPIYSIDMARIIHYHIELREHCSFTYNHSTLMNQIKKTAMKYQFRNYVIEELIAKAMHPCRIQHQMSLCDDIESFFECMGY